MKKLLIAIAMFALTVGCAPAYAQTNGPPVFAEAPLVVYHCKTGATVQAVTGKATPLFLAAFDESISPDAFIGLIASTQPDYLPVAHKFASVCLGVKTNAA